MSSASPNLIKNIALDSSLTLIFRVLHYPVAFFSNWVIARWFGSEQMGTYFIALNLVITTSAFCCLGLQYGLLRFTAALKASGHVGELRRLFWPALAIVSLLGTAVAVGLYASGGWLAHYFRAPGLPKILGLMVMALPISLATLLSYETVRGWGGVKRVVFQQALLAPITFLVLLTILTQAGGAWVEKSTVLGLAFLLNAVIGFPLIAGSLGFLRGPVEKDVSERHSLKNLLQYSWPLFLMTLFTLGYGGIDSLILGFFTSPEDVAFYGVATRTMMVISLPLLAVNAVVSRLFAQFHQLGDRVSMEIVAQTTARWSYYFALPVALLTMLLAPDILGLFGPGFTKASYAMGILAAAQLVNVAAGSVGFLLMMTGNQLLLISLQGLAVVCTLPLMALCASSLGLNGLAGARALGIVTINVLLSVGVWRRLKIRVFSSKMHWANLSGLLGISVFLLAKPYIGVLGGAAAFSLVYSGMAIKTVQREIIFANEMQSRLGTH